MKEGGGVTLETSKAPTSMTAHINYASSPRFWNWNSKVAMPIILSLNLASILKRSFCSGRSKYCGNLRCLTYSIQLCIMWRLMGCGCVYPVMDGETGVWREKGTVVWVSIGIIGTSELQARNRSYAGGWLVGGGGWSRRGSSWSIQVCGVLSHTARPRICAVSVSRGPYTRAPRRQ